MQSASLIDLDALPPDVRWQIEYALESGLNRHNKKAFWKCLVTEGSDREIIDAAQAEFCEARDVPITLANRYRPEQIRRFQEICWQYTNGHPRRPVVMRGAKGALICQYSLSSSQAPNGWAENVFDRAVSSSKATILDRDESDAFLADLERRIARKYPGVTDAFYRRVGLRVSENHEGATVLIRGKWRFLNRSEVSNVRALQGIIRKTNKLDRRLELAREHMRERLAA
jgi:hypothetical protein